jgi:hypothetical protein
VLTVRAGQAGSGYAGFTSPNYIHADGVVSFFTDNPAQSDFIGQRRAE